MQLFDFSTFLYQVNGHRVLSSEKASASTPSGI
jgi:hypothetical protein